MEQNQNFDRLAFVKRLISTHNLTIMQAAEMMDYSAPASFRHAFNVVQDIDLSRIQAFIDRLGYDLDIQITGGNLVNDDQPAKLSYKQVQALLDDRGANIELRRLFFLRHAMDMRGETCEAIAQKINRSVSCLSYYFKQDDIKLSALYKIVWAMDASIEFIIKPKQEPAPTAGARVARTVITFVEDQPIDDVDLNESKVEVLMDKKKKNRQE